MSADLMTANFPERMIKDFLRACNCEKILGYLAHIIIQELIKVIKGRPAPSEVAFGDSAHLMDGNADNYHELDGMTMPEKYTSCSCGNCDSSRTFHTDHQYLVECAQILLRYGA